MSTTTIEDQLAEIRRRIEQLHASGGVPRLQRHLELVDDVEQRLAELKTRLDVAERSLAADVSGDWATFAAAVEAELESWDTYLERLQTTVAARAWHAREQAEVAIGDVRSRRIAVGERLAQVRDFSGAASQDARKHITAARDELEQKAAELSTKLN
jgi:DNA repair exonuclease SbcCD ATPase subunit